MKGKKQIIKKKVIHSVTTRQFTFGGNLYKVGDKFKGNENQVIDLINKNLIKWQ
jgi:hypothetical protein